MEVTTTVNLNPWQVPNFATVKQKPGLKQDGIQPAVSIPVADLSQEALDSLAQAWLTELYNKADKHSPFHIVRAG
jgi:hypothetical protein